MALTWRDRRKYMYLSVVGALGFLALIFVWQTFFHTTPACSDGKQNGTERGVDCGGSCALICQNDSRAPTVLWARAFPTATNTFTAVAYLQNNMVGAGARQVQYSFQLFDQENNLVTEKTGVVDLPPNQTIPIVETNINVGSRSVARTQFTFARNPVWTRIAEGSIVPMRVSGSVLAQDGTRLTATIHNDSVDDVREVSVVAVLFDSSGVARAASKSLVQGLMHKTSQQLVFTWGAAQPNITRAEIIILPSFK